MTPAMWLASPVLVPLSWAVASVASRRRGQPPPDRVRLDVPVVSVGNLAVGGTGKTPTVAALVTRLSAAGCHVGVVMGSYGSPTRRQPPTVVSDGRRLTADLRSVADEVAMFARAHPAIPLATGHVKSEAASALACAVPLGCLIVDDGFQHHRLARDMDIVVLDAASPFDNGRVLPAGRLREPPSAIAGADAIVLSHADQRDDHAIEAIRRLAPLVPVVESIHVPVRLRRGGSDECLDFACLLGAHVTAVCGIGRPSSFLSMVRRLGADARLLGFADHHRYSPHDMARLAALARGSRIVTTAKDEAKWLGVSDFEYWTLDIAVEWNPKDALVDRVLALCRARA
ncbi:tetraacyldisaccharide 4'-kinase [Candidatus Poribacteria bacterium]|nr:tetraacyldisaccharide 4'-kinase [Candidatus Poribacteria bacterium]